MDFLAELALFAAKAFLIVLAIVLVIGAIARVGRRGRSDEERGQLRVKKLADRWKKSARALERALLPRRAFKALLEQDKKQEKADRALLAPPQKAHAFVVDFDGNLRASQVNGLREEIGAILSGAQAGDEVVVRLKSPGGLVYAYGLAASQLERVRQRGLKLTVAVDQVAASGGYMMAVVADQILAAPFAVIGSIGVVAGFPNFHRWLERRDIDFELMTAGKFKRTMTMFGKNTEEGRKKFQEELEVAHTLFKSHITRFRPQLDLDKVATGEHWYGQDALGLGLVDRITTSDDYLLELRQRAEVMQVQWVPHRRIFERLGGAVESGLSRGVERLWEKSEEQRFL